MHALRRSHSHFASAGSPETLRVHHEWIATPITSISSPSPTPNRIPHPHTQLPHHPLHTSHPLPPTSQPSTPQHPPPNQRPYRGTNTHQPPRPHIPTIHKNFQCRHIIHDHRPTDRRRTTRQIILPDNQQYREKFRAAAHQQRGRYTRRVWKVGHAARPEAAGAWGQVRGRDGAEQADGEVEG